ncbi:MAG: DUF6477 family protein [Pseudomonadota bacterium]
MQHLPTQLIAVTRPRLLVRAAQAGLSGYRRERHLPRFLRGSESGRDPGRLLAALCAAEEACEDARRGREADYSFMRHVSLLIALLAEMKAVNQTPGTA